MDIDLDVVLAGFGEEEPSGPDLEYDPEFADLAIAATAKGEQQVGDKVLEAEEADFAEVVKIGTSLLTRTMDVRVGVYLAEAGLNRGGFPDFSLVMEYMRRALEEFWDTVHPQLDADDDDDPTERVNALVGLVDPDTVLKQLRRAPLTESKMMGRFSLRHIAVAKGEMVAPANMDNPPDMATVNAAFKDTDEAVMTDIRLSLESAVGNVQSISALLDDKVPGQGPDFAPLVSELNNALAAIAECLGGAAPMAADTAGGAGGEAAAAGAPAAGGGAGVGAINSPNDVLRAMDLINEYYARNEPSSPVPLFVNRAKRLVSADFMTIMNDMATTGLEEVRAIGGLPDEEY